MKKVVIALAAIAVLSGCAANYNGGISIAEQKRIEAEVEASRQAAAQEFPRFVEICKTEFPDAANAKDDGNLNLSNQSAVNVALTSGWRNLVCSVNRKTLQVERVYYANQALSLAGYRDLLKLATAPAQQTSSVDAAVATPKIETTKPAQKTKPNANAVLLEACNNIADSAKRLECFKAIPQATQTQASALSEVKRAFNDLQSILNAGTSYNSYSSQLESVVKALGNFKSSTEGEDGRVVALLQEAVEAYKDAQFFWQQDINWYARSGNATAYPGGLPMEYTGTAYLALKYNLRTQKSDFWGLSTGLPRQETLMKIWSFSDFKIKAAFSDAN